MKDSIAILLLGHGSRAPEANQAMYQVARDLAATSQYLTVECAFLEISQPDIPSGLDHCKASGANQIIVIPYFLHLGNHVQRDLPSIITVWQQTNPAITITLGAHLGYSPALVGIVEERIRQARQTTAE